MIQAKRKFRFDLDKIVRFPMIKKVTSFHHFKSCFFHYFTYNKTMPFPDYLFQTSVHNNQVGKQKDLWKNRNTDFSALLNKNINSKVFLDLCVDTVLYFRLHVLENIKIPSLQYPLPLPK